MIDQLYTYNSLYDDDPEIQELLARKEAESGISALQQTVLNAIEHDYPALLSFAQQQVVLVRNVEKLRKMIRMVYKAPNEERMLFAGCWQIFSTSFRSYQETV